MVTTKQPWSDVLTDPTRGGSQNLYNLLAGIGEGGQADPTGKFAMGPQNAFSDEQMRKFQTSGLRNLQAGNRAFNAGAGMSAAARGVAGPDLATMLGNQQSANTRDTLANMQWQAQQAGQKLGMDQYDQLLKALGIVGPQATTESQQSLDALLAGLQGGEATGTGEGTADAGYTTAAQRQAEAELAQLAEQFGLTQEQARKLAGYEEATGTTAEQRQAEAELAQRKAEATQEATQHGTEEANKISIAANEIAQRGTELSQTNARSMAETLLNEGMRTGMLNQYTTGSSGNQINWKWSDACISARKSINQLYEKIGLPKPFDDNAVSSQSHNGTPPVTPGTIPVSYIA